MAPTGCCYSQGQPGCAGGFCQQGEELRDLHGFPWDSADLLFYKIQQWRGWWVLPSYPDAYVESLNDRLSVSFGWTGDIEPIPPLIMSLSLYT